MIEQLAEMGILVDHGICEVVIVDGARIDPEEIVLLARRSGYRFVQEDRTDGRKLLCFSRSLEKPELLPLTIANGYGIMSSLN